MNYEIVPIERPDYLAVVDVWECSVRATHHFLTEADIQFFKPLILSTYLDAVELRSAKDSEGIIIGFLGVLEEKLEMLFIHPDYFGRGIGKSMLDYGMKHLGVTKVDVNEQNEQAVGFYLHYGFKTIARSELDGTGKPYPILHMELSDGQGVEMSEPLSDHSD